MALQGTASSGGPYVTSNGVIADGQILPSSFAASYASGEFNHVPVISGMTHDEGSFGLAVTEYYENPRAPFSAADYSNIVNAICTGNSGPAGTPPPYPRGTVHKVEALYPLSAYPTPQLALTAIETIRIRVSMPRVHAPHQRPGRLSGEFQRGSVPA